MLLLKFVEEACWVVVFLEKAGKHPADGQFKVEKMCWWLLKVPLNVSETLASWFALSEHGG